MKKLSVTTALLATLALCLASSGLAQGKPNVVFIMSDDLNDWVGAFGGNKQAITPHLDRFCRETAMAFTNTHVPGPVCGPSRSALLSGFRPETTGCYTNSSNMRGSALVQQHATLPEYFSKHGYTTISRGKIFHRHQTGKGADMGQWAFEVWKPTTGNYRIQKAALRKNHLVERVDPHAHDHPHPADETRRGVQSGRQPDGFVPHADRSLRAATEGKDRGQDHLAAAPGSDPGLALPVRHDVQSLLHDQ
jgi:arylsulfatase A-like enzyme